MSSQPKAPGTTAMPPSSGDRLGDGVVDRDLGQVGQVALELGPTVGVSHAAAIARRPGVQVGLEPREVAEQHVGAGDEHPRVPDWTTRMRT